MAMTILLLAITCANLASLQIARASARMKEISIRLAIGASRSRVVLQLLTESALIVVVGALAALLVAGITVRGLVGEMGEVANRLQLVTTFLDTRILAFTLALAGRRQYSSAWCRRCWPRGQRSGRRSAPGLRPNRRPVAPAARARDRATGAQSRARYRFGTVRPHRLQPSPHRYRLQTDRLVQFRLNPGAAGYDRVRCEAAFREVLEGIRAAPRCRGRLARCRADARQRAVRFRSGCRRLFEPGRHPRPGWRQRRSAWLLPNGEDSARARTGLFGDRYGPLAPSGHRQRVVRQTIPSESRSDWPDHWSRYGGPARFQYEIVGISKDARLNNLRDKPAPTFYFAYRQFDVLNASFFLVRASADRNLLRRSIEELVRRLEPELPVIGYVTIDEQIDPLLRPERLVALLSLSFGLLATGLGAIGLYGVMAFSVARRTRRLDCAWRSAPIAARAPNDPARRNRHGRDRHLSWGRNRSRARPLRGIAALRNSRQRPADTGRCRRRARSRGGCLRLVTRPTRQPRRPDAGATV